MQKSESQDCPFNIEDSFTKPLKLNGTNRVRWIFFDRTAQSVQEVETFSEDEFRECNFNQSVTYPKLTK